MTGADMSLKRSSLSRDSCLADFRVHSERVRSMLKPTYCAIVTAKSISSRLKLWGAS